LDPTFEENELELLSALAVEFLAKSETKKTVTERNNSVSAWRKRLN
jgi:hypothetical protein